MIGRNLDLPRLLRKLGYRVLPSYIKIAAAHDSKLFWQYIKQIEPYIGDIKSKRALDLGCGARFPFSLLLHNSGGRVTGIDPDVSKGGISLKKYWRILRDSGIKSLVVRLIDDLYANKIYYRELSKSSGIPLRFQGACFKRNGCQPDGFC